MSYYAHDNPAYIMDQDISGLNTFLFSSHELFIRIMYAPDRSVVNYTKSYTGIAIPYTTNLEGHYTVHHPDRLEI